FQARAATCPIVGSIATFSEERAAPFRRRAGPATPSTRRRQRKSEPLRPAWRGREGQYASQGWTVSSGSSAVRCPSPTLLPHQRRPQTSRGRPPIDVTGGRMPRRETRRGIPSRDVFDLCSIPEEALHAERRSK